MAHQKPYESLSPAHTIHARDGPSCLMHPSNACAQQCEHAVACMLGPLVVCPSLYHCHISTSKLERYIERKKEMVADDNDLVSETPIHVVRLTRGVSSSDFDSVGGGQSTLRS